jgi:hypothetical protein
MEADFMENVMLNLLSSYYFDKPFHGDYVSQKGVALLEFISVPYNIFQSPWKL